MVHRQGCAGAMRNFATCATFSGLARLSCAPVRLCDLLTPRRRAWCPRPKLAARAPFVQMFESGARVGGLGEDTLGSELAVTQVLLLRVNNTLFSHTNPSPQAAPSFASSVASLSLSPDQ